MPTWSPAGNGVGHMKVNTMTLATTTTNESMLRRSMAAAGHLERLAGTSAVIPIIPGYFIGSEPGGSYGFPAWNPNPLANQIAFWRGGAYNESTIAVKNIGAPALSEQRLITNTDATDSYLGTFYSWPTWNPAGTKLAFVRRQGGPNYQAKQEILIMNADGSNVQNLTTNNFGSYDDHPTFSPDGERIAFPARQPRTLLR